MSNDETSHNRRRWVIGAAAAAVVLGAVVGALLNDGDDPAPVTSGSSTTSSPDTTTTTNPDTTTTEARFVPDVDAYAVAYPSPLTSQRFQSPESAAQSYATEVLGFTELVLGEFLEGDSRSGEVPITDREGNAETLVLVRQMEDDTWFVRASVAPDITVETPEAGDAIASPFETAGTALAFEGTVDVLVRPQDDPAVLGEGFVTGSGAPPAEPFEGEITFTQPSEDRPGIVVYRTLSPEDGHVMQASSFPVRLVAAP